MDINSKIFIAGGSGMVGSAIIRKLKSLGYLNLISPRSSELNLLNQSDVNNFFSENLPEYVFLAAAKVGGIKANNLYKADFIYDNLQFKV